MYTHTPNEINLNYITFLNTRLCPVKSNEKVRRGRKFKLDKKLYRRRNVVERCIGWLKELRRIATHYDKLAQSYLAMVKMAFIQRYFKVMDLGHSLVGYTHLDALMKIIAICSCNFREYTMLARSLREYYAVYLFLKCVLTLSHPFYFLVE